MMGKQSRAKQRKRQLSSIASQESGERLHLTIATTARSAESDIFLKKEVELVKAGLLYADEIKLISPAAAGLTQVLQMAIVDHEGFQRYIAASDAKNGGNSLKAVNVINKIAEVDPVKLKRLTGYEADPELLRKAREVKGKLDESLEQTRAYVDEVLKETGASVLEPAYRAGILELSDSGLQEDHDIVGSLPNYLSLVLQALQDPKTHLIFDDRIAEFVRLVVDENLFKPNPLAVSHAGQAALGSGFVARLPTFSVAPIDELIDLRNDLKKPLSRYRRGVAKMADRLSSRAYDVELNAELDDLWRMEVRPALDEIRDEFSQHSFVRELARSMATDVKSLVTAATGESVVVGVEGLSHLGSLASILGALAPAGVVAAQQVAKAHYARRDNEQIQEKHDLFYLYDLNRRLERSK